MAIEDFYTAKFTIYKLNNLVDSGGAFKPTYSVKASNVSGLMRLLSGSEQVVNMSKGVTSTHRFYCAVQGITETNVIKDSSGKYYDILFVDNVHGLNRFLTIDCAYNPSLQEEVGENVA